ncbi:MAG: serine hydrolase [Pseudomonadota bacterium]
MNRLFPSERVSRGDGPVWELPKGVQLSFKQETMDWAKTRSVTSLLVLHHGKIVLERYFHATQPSDRRMSWSMAKSVLSALFGIIRSDGHFDDLDEPVVRYVPRLKNGAYRDVTVRQVLQMTSGVKFDEDYMNPRSDINRMARYLVSGGSMDDFVASLTDREAAPGELWQYVSIDTHVLGMVIRGATGHGLPNLLSQHIFRRLGLEAEPYYVTDANGVAFALGGLSLTTRDFARFALLMQNLGEVDGVQIIPKHWVLASTVASAPTTAGEAGYGYQWWIPADAEAGEFCARGIYGQYIYVNRKREAVIVSTAADRNFRNEGVFENNIAKFRNLITSL